MTARLANFLPRCARFAWASGVIVGWASAADDWRRVSTGGAASGASSKPRCARFARASGVIVGWASAADDWRTVSTGGAASGASSIPRSREARLGLGGHRRLGLGLRGLQHLFDRGRGGQLLVERDHRLLGRGRILLLVALLALDRLALHRGGLLLGEGAVEAGEEEALGVGQLMGECGSELFGRHRAGLAAEIGDDLAERRLHDAQPLAEDHALDDLRDTPGAEALRQQLRRRGLEDLFGDLAAEDGHDHAERGVDADPRQSISLRRSRWTSIACCAAVPDAVERGC